jgi:hypothetical protein
MDWQLFVRCGGKVTTHTKKTKDTTLLMALCDLSLLSELGDPGFATFRGL